MSRMEMAMIIILCLTPIIALVILLPKKLKFHKKPKKIKESAEKKEEQQLESETPPVEQNEIKPEIIDTPYVMDSDLDSIRDFAKNKKTTKPTRKTPDLSKLSPHPEFSFRRENNFRTENQTEQKSIKEQFDELSPEMKALIMSGAFDRKDYN